ncbi:MAG: molybdopterin molybdotransferase MoeA [Nitrospirota bacterium]|nr:molybdopterin molybdotransferase MoeA [Nitrospirota bacterium]
MIPFEEALEQVLKIAPQPRFEQVMLHDALGRVLAEEITAPRDLPPWNNSAVDGFAVRAIDTTAATPERPIELSVLETIAAGAMPTQRVDQGAATRIMTGAPMPEGADAVVMVEDSVAVRNDLTRITCRVDQGENVRLKGEDVRKGQVVVPSGTVLRPGHIGMLASLGRSQLRTTRRPVVGILSTGDELVEIDKDPGIDKILNVNSHALAAQVRDVGAVPVMLGIARDTKDAVRDGIREGLNCDILLISGGVSMGDFDFVRDVMSELGGGLTFWKVRMKPARPLAFGPVAGVPTFGLPGNPVSSMVSFEVFVRPFIRKWMGHQHIERPVVMCKLTEKVGKKPGRRFFLRTVVTPDAAGGYTCRTTGDQGSGVLTSMALADGLMDLAEDLSGPLMPGSMVPVRLFA